MSILWNFDKYAEIEELPFDPSGIDDIYWISDVERLIPAGLPLKRTSGVVAPLGKNDTPTCFAAEDYHIILTNAQQPKLIPCVTKGYIEKAKVLEAMGVEQDPTADWAESLAALGLYLVDELGNLPGGSGGGSSGGALVAHFDSETGLIDRTWQDLSDACDAGKVVLMEEVSEKSGALIVRYLALLGRVDGEFLAGFNGSEEMGLIATSTDEQMHRA